MNPQVKIMLAVRYKNSHKGIVIPLIIGVLTIFFILVIALSQTSTDSYNQVSLINHRLHARFMTLGTIEEMHNIVWMELSNPEKLTDKRLEIIQAVAGGGEHEWDLLSKLQYATDLELKQKEAKKQQDKYTISVFEATAKFHDFHQIRYSVGADGQTGLYESEIAFYRSPDGGSGGAPSSGASGTHKDWYGFVTYKVKAQHGIVTKEVEQTRPVKIVDTTPMGRDYAVFEMEPSQGASLNEGPGFYIQGNNDARIRLIGPYILDTEGKSDGTSNGGGFSFSSGGNCGGLNYVGGNKWYDDAYVPPPKWNTACLPINNGGRLSSKGGGGLSYLICCLPILGSDTLGMMFQPMRQTWISSKVDVGKQNFSLRGVDGSVDFKGLIYQSGANYDSPQGIAEEWDVAPGTEIRHEGLIIGNYKTHTVTAICLCYPAGWWTFCGHVWFGGSTKDIQQVYAFIGDEKPEVDWVSTVIGVAMNAASAIGGAGNAAMTMQSVGAAVKDMGQQLLLSSGMMTASGGFNTNTVPRPEDLPNMFPSGYRPITRAAVRHVKNMDEALWKKKKLLLDGVYWVDEMKTNKDFEYVGKGYLAYMQQTAGDVEGALKKVKPVKENEDFLNVFYFNFSQEKGLEIDADTFEASVFSHPGINPKKPLILRGNLMSKTINKAKMDNQMVVSYWNEKLHDITPEEYLKNFLVLSVSPKIEAFSEVNRKLQNGIGTDGIEVITGDIEE